MNAQITRISQGSDELGNFRREVMGQMSVLLENQTRTDIFTTNISALISRMHNEILTDLTAELATKDTNVTAINHAIHQCKK